MIQVISYSALPEEAKYIRETVFVKEQHFNVEFDEIDEIATHLVLFVDDSPAACCRLFPDEQPDCYIVGRIAVLKAYRGRHLGERMLAEAEDAILAKSGKKVSLSAQLRVKAFYEKQGYIPSGAVYLDEYCEHIHMEKRLLAAE